MMMLMMVMVMIIIMIMITIIIHSLYSATLLKDSAALYKLVI